jgi:hypothetical protein
MLSYTLQVLVSGSYTSVYCCVSPAASRALTGLGVLIGRPVAASTAFAEVATAGSVSELISAGLTFLAMAASPCALRILSPKLSTDDIKLLAVAVTDVAMAGMMPRADDPTDSGDTPFNTCVADDNSAGLMPRAAAPADTRDAVFKGPVTPGILGMLIPNVDVAVLIMFDVLRDASDGKFNELVSDDTLKSPTLGIEFNMSPGLNVLNHSALPAKLPAMSNPPRDAMSNPGISKDVKELTSRNSSPKSVTSDPISGAKSRTAPIPMSTIASNPPAIILFSF